MSKLLFEFAGTQSTASPGLIHFFAQSTLHTPSTGSLILMDSPSAQPESVGGGPPPPPLSLRLHARLKLRIITSAAETQKTVGRLIVASSTSRSLAHASTFAVGREPRN